MPRRHLVLQEGLGQKLLQPGVLGGELLQPLRVRDAQPAVLAAPEVVARLGEPVATAELLHWQACLGFPQEPDDLRFGEPLLHVRSPLRMIGLYTWVLLKQGGRRPLANTAPTTVGHGWNLRRKPAPGRLCPP
jgi:hypothetical protein